MSHEMESQKMVMKKRVVKMSHEMELQKLNQGMYKKISYWKIQINKNHSTKVYW